jgi:adenylate cyclase
MRGKGKAFQILFVVIAALVAADGQFLFQIAKFQWSFDDYIELEGRKTPKSAHLLFLALDDLSVRLEPDVDIPDFLDGENPKPEERHALELMAGKPWPWSREIYALAIERLFAAGARIVVLDLTFPKPGQGDAALRDAIDRHADRMVVAGNLVTSFGDRKIDFSTPSDTVVSPQARAKAVVGYDNFWTYLDDRVRSTVYRTTLENPDHFTQSTESSVLRSMALLATKKAGFSIPSAEDFRPRHIRYAGPPGTFPPRPFYEIFVPRFWRANYASGRSLEGKIVVIGPSGNWQQDEHQTPFGLMAGSELHLNAINCLLSGDFITDLPPWPRRLIVYAAAVLVLVLSALILRPFLRLIACAGLAACWVMLALWLYNEHGMLVPTLAPVGMLIVGGFICISSDFVFERVEKGRFRRTLERYVSKNVVGKLLDDPKAFDAHLGGITKRVTVLFSDIRNFTRFSAQTSGQTLVAQLNEYFTAMVECVFAHGGTVDKFIGDALMAVWGNATSAGPQEDARAAARCAIAMRIALAALNDRWRTEGRPVLDIGIALHGGDVVVGNIGSPNKMEFTVIGDAVNAAWRLQERSKEHPGEILIGESVAELLEGEFRTAEAGALTVGGSLEVKYSILATIVKTAP